MAYGDQIDTCHHEMPIYVTYLVKCKLICKVAYYVITLYLSRQIKYYTFNFFKLYLSSLRSLVNIFLTAVDALCSMNIDLEIGRM